ncbi:uncharacterized protein (DUF1697 family) [Yoonia maritima]|uniref:Uncharacterized protein (DUF1697 family) n=1 Tax=Yoonia maritima TaxID=1435347 RepID=A0A2T0W1A1_9RHOB|nr:DUF1697 domain-containing protein [Yoonia maritima]PRY78782.1 uncharacterized protein (DUF1697 family) [Yoonia maritima]
MAKFVAFLRGINVGGNCKIPMADLRELCAEVTNDPDVRSYIASGNLVFETDRVAADVAAQISGAIKQKFGFEVPVLVLSEMNMRAISSSCPFPDEAGNKVHAFLCLNDPAVNQDKIDCLKTPTEQIAIIDRTVWFFAPEGVGRSKLMANMESCIGPATARNLNTISKMVEMLDD